MNRLAIPAALVLALFAAAPAAAEISARKVQTAGLQCQAGQKALAGGDRDAARAAFSKALVAVPGYPDALVGLGNLAMADGKFEEALGQYRQALEGYTALGADMEMIEMRRYADVQDRKRSLREEQSVLTSTASKVSETVRRSRMAAIDTELRQLEAVEPPKAGHRPQPPGELHFHIGNALVRLDRLPEAVVEWEACVAASPTFAPVHNNLAWAYGKQGRLEEARKSLARAEELGFTVNPQFKRDLAAAAK